MPIIHGSRINYQIFLLGKSSVLKKIEQAIQVYENANTINVGAIRDGIKPLIDWAVEIARDIPLSIEDLAETADPVWIQRNGDVDLCCDDWAVVEGPICLTYVNDIPVAWLIRVWWFGSEVEDYPEYENYGKTWVAYRHRPMGNQA